VTLVFRGGNHLLPAVYSLGALLVALAVRRSGKFEWKFWENLVSGIVLFAMVAWYFQGTLWATVLATIATGTATIPQMKDAWRAPNRTSGWLYLGFTAANAISAAGGSAWTIEQRLYGSVCAAVTFVLVVLSFRPLRAAAAPSG
jgi:hypothetical protein